MAEQTEAPPAPAAPATGSPKGLDILQLKSRTIAELKTEIESVIPMGRLGDPREIAGLALYLASDASSYMTGSLVVIDGGRTLW